jgi:hypothetical protein
MTLRYVDKDQLAAALARKHIGHDHFWERAMSRRSMLGTTLAATGTLAAASLLKPLRALAGGSNGAEPRPVDGTFSAGGVGWHVDGPGPGPTTTAPTAEMSTVYDFDGIVAAAQVQGMGTGRQGPVSARFPFDTDMRFMQGRYRGMDGRMYRGTFGFI